MATEKEMIAMTKALEVMKTEHLNLSNQHNAKSEISRNNRDRTHDNQRAQFQGNARTAQRGSQQTADANAYKKQMFSRAPKQPADARPDNGFQRAPKQPADANAYKKQMFSRAPKQTAVARPYADKMSIFQMSQKSHHSNVKQNLQNDTASNHVNRLLQDSRLNTAFSNDELRHKNTTEMHEMREMHAIRLNDLQEEHRETMNALVESQQTALSLLHKQHDVKLHEITSINKQAIDTSNEELNTVMMELDKYESMLRDVQHYIDINAHDQLIEENQQMHRETEQHKNAALRSAEIAESTNLLLNTSREVLAESKQKLAESEKKLAESEKKLAESEKKLEAAESETKVLKEELKVALNNATSVGKIAESKQKLAESEKKLAAADNETEVLKAELKVALNNAKSVSETAESKQKIAESEKKLAESEKKLEAAESETKVLKEELKVALQTADAEKKLVESAKKLAESKQKIKESEQKIEESAKKLAESEQKIAEAIKTVVCPKGIWTGEKVEIKNDYPEIKSMASFIQLLHKTLYTIMGGKIVKLDSMISTYFTKLAASGDQFIAVKKTLGEFSDCFPAVVFHMFKDDGTPFIDQFTGGDVSKINICLIFNQDIATLYYINVADEE
jgi:hypothetical protein